MGAELHIDLAAHSKFRKINAGLNGKTRVGNNPAFIVGFQVVHVCANAMHFGSDRMPGAMNERYLRILHFLCVCGRAISFRTAELSLAASTCMVHAKVTRIVDDFETPLNPARGGFADETHRCML